MASRNIGGSIQAALKDLFDERAVVEDAIQKLQSLLEAMKSGAAPKRRGRPPGSGRKKVAAPTKAVRQPAAKKKAQTSREWSPAARRKAAKRMRDYWAERRKEAEARKSKAASKRRGRAAAK